MSILQHWIANNLFGLAFSINGVELLSLNRISTGCILLGGLFIYDIFWVFATDVMVTVAKSFEAPIKCKWFSENVFSLEWLSLANDLVAMVLNHATWWIKLSNVLHSFVYLVHRLCLFVSVVFPQDLLENGLEANNFAMLGLGDIVIPGIFIALLLRYDNRYLEFKTVGQNYATLWKDYGYCLIKQTSRLIPVFGLMFHKKTGIVLLTETMERVPNGPFILNSKPQSQIPTLLIELSRREAQCQISG